MGQQDDPRIEFYGQDIPTPEMRQRDHAAEVRELGAALARKEQVIDGLKQEIDIRVEQGKALNADKERFKVQVEQLQRQVRKLVEALEASASVLREYAARNPKWVFEGKEQDPMGVHALLSKIDAALAKVRQQ